MIVLTRGLARRFRAVASKCTLKRGPAPPVTLRTSGGVLSVTANVGEVTVSLAVPHPPGPDESVAIPMTLLAACEAANDDPVALDFAAGKGVATWSDRGVPRSVAFEAATPRERLPQPDSWSESCPRLVLALAECGKTAGRDPARFALDRVQVRGKGGQVVGTDGKLALVASGFRFPFAQDLLVPPVPALALRELASQVEVRVALVADHLALKLGPWTMWLGVGAGRYPDVAAITPRVPDPSKIEFDEAEALALLDALPRLPGSGDDGKPVTLAVGGDTVTVFAADAGNSVAMRLPRSTVSGPAGRVALDRTYLGRALSLGCRTATLSGPQKPVAFAGNGWLALVMPLDASLAVAATARDRVLELPGTTSKILPQKPEVTPPPVSPQIINRIEPVKPAPDSHPPPAADSPDLLAEAEALRSQLADALSRTARLVAALKHQRRRERAVESALSGLKSLSLSARGGP